LNLIYYLIGNLVYLLFENFDFYQMILSYN
jgi:hypothetical protein